MIDDAKVLDAGTAAARYRRRYSDFYVRSNAGCVSWMIRALPARSAQQELTNMTDDTIPERDVERVALVRALEAALGYMMNVRIDIVTGTNKGTTVATLSGGIIRTREALALATPGAFIVAD